MHVHTQYLGVQAPTAEVRVELEAPTEVDEGMYKYSPNSIILLNFICGFCFTLDVISIPVHALHNYYIGDIYTIFYTCCCLL